MTKHVRHTVLAMRQVIVERGQFKLHIDELSLRQGEIACLVGSNGCGKTTLLLTALGLLPHTGSCSVLGVPFDGTDPAVKAHIGFIPDDPELLFAELTAREQWAVSASVIRRYRKAADTEHLISRSEQLAQTLLFTPPVQLAREYSHGMRKKTQIVQALLGSPEVLVVDELRNGLDPLASKQAEDLLRRECRRGAAVLAATHDLWWAERFADHIYVLHQGRIVAAGTSRQLRKPGEPDLEAAFCRIIEEVS